MERIPCYPNFSASQSIQSESLYRSRPIIPLKNSVLSFLEKMILFLVIFCSYNRLALAASVGRPYVTETGVDQYGAYVEFHIAIRDQSGSHAAGNIQEVSTGRLYCNNILIATFSASSSAWDNQGINAAINSGYGIAVVNSSQMLNANTGNIVISEGSGGEATLVLRWYVPQSQLGSTLAFSSHEYITGYYVTLVDSYDGSLGDQGGQEWSSNQTVSNFIPTPSFSFSTSKSPGQMAVNYSFNTTIGASVASSPYTITHWMDDDKMDAVMDQTNNSPTGSLNVGIQNSQFFHAFHTQVVGQGGYLTYELTTQVGVPAYVWPSSFTATYDNKDSVKIQWYDNIYSLGTGFVDNDNFEVQRSTDNTFATNVTTVATYAYNPSQANYSVYDNLSNLKGGTTVYYRIRRTKTANDWNWNVSGNTTLAINMNTTQKAYNAVLANSNGTPQAVITWEPFRGVWTTGTKFSIKKTNKTTSAAAGTIDLTEDQARSGKYVDENIIYCNTFTYSILVTLGNGYPSPAETQVPGSVLAVNIGTITNLTASKGYFPDRTELRWHSQGDFDNYIVKRRIYGSSDNFIQIANIGGSSTSDLQTDDSKGSPGVYYQYMVLGAVKCNNKVKYSQDTLYAVGFRAPTGNIYGRVTYENGQAVENVAVRLQNDDNAQLGQSIYLNGNASSYLKIDSLLTPFQDSSLTIEAWIRPDDVAPKNQVIFSRGGQYELGFNAGGQLYFTYNGRTVAGTYFNKNRSYVHITGIHSRDSLSLMINDSLIGKMADPFSPVSNVDKAVYIGRNQSGNNYKGYIDEMSVWNIALSVQQVARNYTLLLTGGEKGLAAYWRFDETIANQFYDISYLNENYHMNDGIMDAGFVKRTNVIPDSHQLSLKAYTDSTGNYLISGIPYIGNGTNYTVVPLFGTHQFDPVSVNRLVAAGSSSFTVDFTDRSSFPVTGIVYYYNSTVPVEGVQFQIDSKYAQQNNGDIIQTDAAGKFSISVPVGTHQVKAVKNNHIFMNEGRITNRFGKDLNYQSPGGPFILYDSTALRFIGRVAGGAVQEAYPLGHSLSTNNLGKNLSISIELPSGTKYDLYKGAKVDSIVTFDHLLPPNEIDSSKIHKTRVEYYQHKIVIYPDSVTGEFEVNLIPEKFIVQSVNATGWGDLLEGKPVSLNFTNKFVTKYSVYSFKDSTQNNQGAWDYNQFTDSVAYNDSYKFIKRVTPSISIVQLSSNGQELSYFGDSVYQYHSLGGAVQKIPVIDRQKIGRAEYLFSYPVFTQNKLYHIKVKAFEEYPFYSSVKQDGTPVIAQQNGKDIVEQVPTADGHMTFNNKIRNGSSQTDILSLDSTGVGYYNFTAGEPEIAAPGTKEFAASVRFGQSTDINWNWLGNPQMQVFVIGGKLSGADFVTAGPNKILMVLRDPPGNTSYSYVENGSTINNSSTYTGTIDQVGNETFIQQLGAELITWQGVGVGTIQTAVASTGIEIGIHHEEHFTGSNTTANSTTFTTRFQTSSDPAFVGAVADLYVGYSSNITYGQSNNLIIIKRADLKSTDSVIYQPSVSSPYLVVDREGINFGQKFGTLFAYPQQHIVKVLIPNLINIRNNLLLPPSTSPAEAQQKANNGRTAVYVSKLPASDPKYGKSNNDTLAFGPKAKTDPVGDGESYKIYYPQSSLYRTDTIMILNEYVHGWQQEIAHNEQEKLNSTLIKNYSFHAGNPIDYSMSTTYSHDTTYAFNIILSGSVMNSTEAKILGAGFEFKFNESLGTQQGGNFEQRKDSTATLGFQLSANGTDEYISVDVNKAKDDGVVFRTKGGATGCPYEGATLTQYYQPGTPIDPPTVKIDIPRLKIDKPVVNNVPATQKASYTLYLSNESEARLPATFVLSYANTDSVKGAYIAVDGASIAGGRSFAVQYGQTVAKVLTLVKGPNAMDYNNIPIILHSACQYAPTGYQDLIADTVLISAHFVPSCSNVKIKSPTDNWILNTLSQVNQQGKRYLPITLDQFDENNNLFDHIELQYKPSANSQWITAMSFYGDSAKYKAAQGDKAFITNAEGINYNLVMDDASFNDQKYDIRGVAVCKLGPNNFITTPSNVVSGIKDTYYPRLFGTPEPGNGILGLGDNIRLNFNETIASGLLTPADFQVTGIRNGAKGDHSVSVQLDGQSDYIKSEFDKNLTGKDITAEMWVLPNGKENGTVFSQGDSTESMELAFTADNHLEVIMGNKVIESDKPLNYQQGQWAHVALVYHAADSTVSAFYNFQAVIHNVSVNSYTGTGPFVFGRSIRKQGNFFAGKIHGACVWSQDQPATTLQTNSLTLLSGAEEGLLAYYPMTEGRGATIFDKAHGDNARLIGTWSTPPGKALTFDGTAYLKMSTGTSPVTSDMDYTFGLWFKAKPGQTDAALVSNGKGDGMDPGAAASKNLFYLGFENGRLTFENNGFKVQIDSNNYLDNQWHHVALAVNRLAGTGRLYVDDTLKKYFNTQNLGGIAAAYAYLGARVWYSDTNAVAPQIDRYFKGEIDEFRIWNTYLDQKLIARNSNIRLSGTELGLMAYYPFEKYFEFQNQKEMGFTLDDQKVQEDPNVKIPPAVAVNAQESDNMAPIKDRGPVNNLQFDYVVNDDALIINLLEPKHTIDKTIITLQVKGAQDLNGNSLVSPITWTTFIDQNPLKWSDDEFNFSLYQHHTQQFESYIVNSGGQIQHFQLDNLPGWLTATPSSGSVDPEGKQKITFTINEGLNIGTYNEIVYMRNDNGETEALPINVKVEGKAPDWKVNPAEFDNSMTIYGKIRINGVFSADSSDILAAFINGKCVGVTHNVYFASQDLWYAFLTVYNSEARTSRGDIFEFRLWDASTGKTYQGIPSQPVSFQDNDIVGTPDDPVIFDGREILLEDLNLNQGWSWLSFNLLNNNLQDVNTTLGNGRWASGDIVKDDRRFDEYSDTRGWTGKLSFNNTSLFKLQTVNAQTLTIGGTLPTLKNIPIPVNGNGWNYISYLPQVNMKLEEALADYEASTGDEIKSQTGFSMYSEAKGWIGNLTYLEPGKGYMLYRADRRDTRFVYPTVSGSLEIHRRAENAGSIKRLNPYQIPVSGNFNFADNMTMIAEVDKGFKLQPDDKILAYVGNDLRGKAQAINDPVIDKTAFFFNISGEQYLPVYFNVQRNGKVIARTKPVVSYFSNSRIGTLQEPFMLHFEKISEQSASTEVTVYPNPFNDKVSIYVNLKNIQASETHNLQMSVWNVAGQLVFKGAKKQINGGYYYTTWNGKNASGKDCTPGVYFIHIKVDDKSYVYKVVKY